MTVHVPQNVPVNFVPVHVPTQDLGPLSVVELDPFGNKTLSVNFKRLHLSLILVSALNINPSPHYYWFELEVY